MANHYFGITDTGKQRTNNEDTFIAEALNNQFITACVIDGLGGYEGGEVAAALARDAIVKALSGQANNVLSLLKQAIVAASNSIQEAKKTQANENYNHMACVVTLSLADINNNKFYYAHVGDTRLYLLRDKSLVKITKDQSFVGFLEDNGRLSEEEAMQHPKRNEINKALGFDISIDTDDYIEVGDSPFLPGDLLMLCSDGLTDMITNKTMAGILNGNNSLQQKAQLLVDAANEAGGNDNITVVLVQNNKKQTTQTAVKPSAQRREVDAPAPANETVYEGQSPVTNTTRNRNLAIPILSFLLFLAIAALAWLYWKTAVDNGPENMATATPIVVTKRNAAEQALMDSINKPLMQTLFLNTDSNAISIVVSDTIFINKDSLTIYGNGTTISAGSTYRGPAFVLSDNCNYVVFDSLSFQNFDEAIWAQQTGIHLRKVRFVNCNIPVVQQFEFPAGVAVSGIISDTIFRTDSLRK